MLFEGFRLDNDGLAIYSNADAPSEPSRVHSPLQTVRATFTAHGFPNHH